MQANTEEWWQAKDSSVPFGERGVSFLSTFQFAARRLVC